MTLFYKCFYIYIYIYRENVRLQTWLQPKSATPSKKINVAIFFENLIIELLILYILNKCVKLHINNMLLTI